MSFQVEYVQHRLKSHQQYMSQLYMTKFQTLPRPKPVIHILRKTIPNDQLPKFARPKKPWVRQGIFDYSILDQVGSGKKRKPAPKKAASSGNEQVRKEKKIKAMRQVQPQASVQAFNPYESMMSSNKPATSESTKANQAVAAKLKKPATPSTPSKMSSKSLYQQEKEAKLKKKQSTANVGSPPPSFSNAAPPSFSGAAPPSFSGKAIVNNQPQKQPQKQPPAVPKVPKVPPAAPKGPPAVPGQQGGPPPVPGQGGPPPVPGQQGGPPPVPPVPGQSNGPPPVPPVPPQ